MSDKQAVAEAVTGRRKALSLSQAALANLAGISRGTVRNIESGSVAPNDSTWERLEPVLGWAKGSLHRLQGDGDPAEVVPIDVLTFLSAALSERIDNEWSHSEARMLLERFVSLMKGAAEDGSLDDNARIELTDVIDGLETFEDEEAVESVQEALTDWFRRGPVRPRTPLREVDRIAPGDRVVHPAFGPGEVIAVKGEHAQKTADIDFGPDNGIKKLRLRYAPFTRIEKGALAPEEERESRSLMDDTRSKQNLDHLGSAVAKLLTEGQVIDSTVAEPDGTENLAVVTMVIRKSTGPLSSGDRKYMANVLNALSSTDMMLRLTDGAIVKVAIKQPEPASKPKFTQPTPPPVDDDPWASASKAKKGGGSNDFSDEPPF